MLCPHNIWDHPHFHQRSSWSLIVTIQHSHQQNLCRKYLEMAWNIFQLTSPPPIPLSTNVARWGVNGANIEIPSTCSYMCWNLTWLNKTHAFMVWDGFKAQGCMWCMHNLWDHPCFHQCSSCNLIVIICHSHQRNRCRKSLEMSSNTFQLTTHHHFHYPQTSHIEEWMGPMLKSLQLMPICIEISHGQCRANYICLISCH